MGLPIWPIRIINIMEHFLFGKTTAFSAVWMIFVSSRFTLPS